MLSFSIKSKSIVSFLYAVSEWKNRRKMFYPNDFKSGNFSFPPRYDARKGIAYVRRNKNNLDRNSVSSDDKSEVSKCRKLVNDFCQNTSIHGVKFIIMESFHWTERLFWGSLVTVAVVGIIYMSLELAKKFSDSPLATVVESTMYPVSDIPYPSVTLCMSNRFNAAKFEEAHKKFLPKADVKTLKIFHLLLTSLNSLEFGGLDEFNEEIFKFTSNELNQLNLTEIIEFMLLTCEEIFISRCWWRNKYFDNCCDDFMHLVKSEYSLCYGFNSAVTEDGKKKEENISNHYPLRTSNYGDWSGLRIQLSTRTDIASNISNDGIIVMVGHPNQWPGTGRFVPGKSATSIVIKPTYSYTTDDVRALSPDQRQCLNVRCKQNKNQSLINR